MESPYNIENYDKSMRVRCPFQGAWSGKGESPCKHADWIKKKYPIYKHSGSPMMPGVEVPTLSKVINEGGIMHLVWFYRLHSSDLEWEAQKECINKGKYNLYNNYYRQNYELKKEIDMEVVEGCFGFDVVDKLRFLIREYGTYHVFEFIHSIVSKQDWENIKDAINKDEYPEFLKKYLTMHICHSCDHKYTKEFTPTEFAKCPQCGWEGY